MKGPTKGPIKGRTNGFTAAKCVLVAMALATVLAPPGANAEMVGRFHLCGKLNAGPFKARVGARGMGCRRVRPLLRAWLSRSGSLAGEGLPRSARAHHWQCRRVIAWACAVNGHRVRLVFDLDLRRHGDLSAELKSALAPGPAGQGYVDYSLTVRNLGSDAVAGTLVDRLPAGLALLSATPSQGRCAAPDAAGRLHCTFGPVRTGFDNGVKVAIRVAYDCSMLDPIPPSSVAVSSPSSDIDPSNNTADVDELDPDCPDPLFDFPPDDPEPPVDDFDLVPPPVDPDPPPEDPPPPDL
jgi:uncharacterized repeat protein (TIGR01451 family)